MNNPDKFEKRIRFVCGFIFGFFISALTIIQYADLLVTVLMSAGIIGLLAGYFAMSKGDDFWHEIKKWL